MKDRVCLLLNEREPAKTRVAEALQARLKDYNITASRLTVTENISEVVATRKPTILVVDYLLGDYSTGLDVLAAVNKLAFEHRPKVLFLTDEPSVPVAVEALRLGALNYYEIDNPNSLTRLAREISELLRASAPADEKKQHSHPGLDELVAHSAAAQSVLREARRLIAEGTNVVAVSGPAGVGKRALAHAMLRARSPSLVIQTIDLRLADEGEIDLFFESLRDATERQGRMILNAQDDDGSFLTRLMEVCSGSSYSAGNMLPGMMAACTDDQTTANSWKAALHAHHIRIPSLAQRAEDVPSLAQRFLKEAQDLSELKIKFFSVETIKWLASLSWPGEVQQLRACVIHAAVESVLDDIDPRASIEAQRSVWDEEQRVALTQTIDPLTAAFALECANFNYRVAAVRLGCSIKDLRGALV